jgi:hypothetical protein
MTTGVRSAGMVVWVTAGPDTESWIISPGLVLVTWGAPLTGHASWAYGAEGRPAPDRAVGP